MIYAVISFEPSEELPDKISTLEVPVYDGEAPIAHFVSFKGTTRELAQKLGYDGNQAGTGIVIPVSNYFGFASRDLWEWLEVNENDK